MKKYFVQTRYPDGEIGLSVNTASQIVEMVGFSDCSDCEYQVFDGSDFGTAVLLVEEPRTEAPFNFHQFKNPVTGKIVFAGYSREH